MRILLATLLFSSLFSYEEALLNLSLRDAERIASEENKQLRIAKEGIYEAKERTAQAVSQYFPSLEYRAEIRDSQKKELFFDIFSNERQPLSHQGYSSMFTIDQPLLSTDLIYNLKGKRFEESGAEYAKAATLNELLLTVRKNYYSVITLEKALVIERENIDYLSFALSQEQKRLNAGGATTFEVHQSKVALSNAISLYYATLQELKNARNALVLSLGIDPLYESKLHLEETDLPIECIPTLSMKLKEAEGKYRYFADAVPSTEDFLSHIQTIEMAKKLVLFSKAEVHEYLEEALERRPDLKFSHSQIGVAEQNLREKQGQYLPKLDGYARFSYNDDYLGEKSFASQPYNWSGGLVLSWNLFDSLLREHKVKEARYARNAKRIAYDKTMQRVEIELRNSLYQLEEALLAYLSSTQSVYLAEQARSQGADKLAFGKIAPLEYRDSVNLLFQARNQQNKAKYLLIASYYQLRYTTGFDAVSY